MTNAQKIMHQFYKVSLGKKVTFDVDRLAVAAALRELINQFAYGANGDSVVNTKDIKTIIQQLETPNE